MTIRYFHPRDNGQWPPTSKDFYPICYALHFLSSLYSSERASISPFKGITGTIFITSLVWRGPWLGIEPGISRTRSQHSTTRLSRRRCNLIFRLMFRQLCMCMCKFVSTSCLFKRWFSSCIYMNIDQHWVHISLAYIGVCSLFCFSKVERVDLVWQLSTVTPSLMDVRDFLFFWNDSFTYSLSEINKLYMCNQTVSDRALQWLLILESFFEKQISVYIIILYFAKIATCIM